MPLDTPATDAASLAMFTVVQQSGTGAPDGTSRVIERVAEPSCTYKYQLQDRALWRTNFKMPIFSLATRGAGSILASYAENRFATGVSVDGEGGNLFCFTTLLRGRTTLIQDGKAVTSTGTGGFALRPGSGTRMLISDDNARSNVFFEVAEVEQALEHALDERLRRPLEFKPDLDWSRGLAASLKRQLESVLVEFRQPDGVTGNPVALASMTDLLVSLVLRAAPHNYSDQLNRSPAGAVPVYVRRAEDFMRANCSEPIRMAHVAAAAGCSVGTLGVVFRHFRGKTPLAALHAIRLEQSHRELTHGKTGASVATVARRHGFTNPTRFSVAFRRRFGEAPSEVARRASR